MDHFYLHGTRYSVFSPPFGGGVTILESAGRNMRWFESKAELRDWLRKGR